MTDDKDQDTTLEPGAEEQAAAGGNEGAQQMPPADFSTLIVSLSTSALINLGEIKNPDTERTEKQLQLAKHAIDLIAMLKDKTEGNLNEQELKILENILADLRMRYVTATG